MPYQMGIISPKDLVSFFLLVSIAAEKEIKIISILCTVQTNMQHLFSRHYCTTYVDMHIIILPTYLYIMVVLTKKSMSNVSGNSIYPCWRLEKLAEGGYLIEKISYL